MGKKRSILPLLFLGFVLTVLTSLHLTSSEIPKSLIQQSSGQQNTSQEKVLGSESPKIYIAAGNLRYGEYSMGGLLTLASTDEPVISIRGEGISGLVEVSVYEADEQTLLDYLVHDKDGKKIKTSTDLKNLRFLTKINHQITSNKDDSKLLLPIGESGIYLLVVAKDSFREETLLLRSNIGAVVKEGNNEYIFWGQNFKTKRSLTEGSLSLYNLQDNLKEIASTSFNSEGVAKASLLAEADIALVRNAGEKAVIPLNLKYLGGFYPYKYFELQEKEARYFTFTDRPLYRPGDTIYFKSILREDTDAVYTIPSGQAEVTVYRQNSVVFEKSYPISENGTINGEYNLPKDTKTGDYRLSVSIKGVNSNYGGYTYFNVEFFRKPEYNIDIDIAKTEFMAGDKIAFKIKGNYFSGQPITNSDQKVKYQIYAADFYEYQSLQNRLQTLDDEYRYGRWWGDLFSEGEVSFNQLGEAEVELEAKIPSDKEKSQIFSIEANFDDGSGNPTFTRKNILVYTGEYSIYRKDQSFYSTQIGKEISLPVILVPHWNANVNDINLTAKIHRENWVKYQEENKKYPSYRKEEEDLPEIKAKTDGQGNAVFVFTPNKVGYYEFKVKGNDSLGNKITKSFYSYVSSEDQPYYSNSEDNDLVISLDKESYLPSETARLTIHSTVPDRDIFLSLERGRVNRFQIVKLEGKKAVVEIPLVETDMPNIYASVSSFSNYRFDSDDANIVVSAESKKLVVNLSTNSKTFGPGEEVTVDVATTDIKGSPVSSELALWAVDKAIFELTDESLKNIFANFWSQRQHETKMAHSLEGINFYGAEMGGGCFAAGTQVLMADGKTKPIEQLRKGDFILTRESEKNLDLVKARIKNIHKASVSGYLIINGGLKVTTNHKLWVNNSWQEAGSIQIGDTLMDVKGDNVEVFSLEWLKGKFEVYNLEIEGYRTFFANGVWVHNQKGGERSVFKDTAYWNPSLRTDEQGKAQIRFKLPDNLTTWVLAAVGATINTRVGQATNEIVVSKDVVVRPILPNILREGDEIVLSALVQNFTENDQTFDVDLKFDAGEVSPATHSGVTIKSKEAQQFYWTVWPKQEKEKAKLTFSAKSIKDQKASDTIVQEIPVKLFGFVEQKVMVGDGPKDFAVKLAEGLNKEKSSITLSLAPTILGSLPTAMKYLINYPYGCVEQTTSRFVPAVIAKVNPDLFVTALVDKNVDEIIQKGLDRLSFLQNPDGGWGWWSADESDAFITAYVVEYILQVKKAGLDVNQQMLSDAKSYLEHEDKEDSQEEIVAKNYALTLLESEKRKVKIDNLDNLSPDLLALAVMSNFKNGDSNSQTNGLSKLLLVAKSQGESLYWEPGTSQHFGSKDASTALAIRAIVVSGGDREIAVRGARYLTNSRRSNYWSNTFATAQVVQAIVDLSKSGEELTPNYTYSVAIDGKEIASGNVQSPKQMIKDIEIPMGSINPKGLTISLSKNGEGQIYSTLLINEFLADRRLKAVKNGIEIARKYVNEKGEEYTLGIGDMVDVYFNVKGLDPNENYGVIEDELPAGLVPINTSFKNEQFSQDISYGSYGIGVSLGYKWSFRGRQVAITSTPLAATPAYKAGIRRGDLILKVNGTPTKGLSAEEVAKKMRGTKWTNVKLTLLHRGEEKPYEVELTRYVAIDGASSVPSYSNHIGEFTENGAILSFREITPGEQTYMYKARVISEGSFMVPPAKASLMYSPEVNGRSDIQVVKTTKQSEIIPGRLIKKSITKSVVIVIIKILVLIFLPVFLIIRFIIFLRRKHRLSRQNNSSGQ